MYKGQYLCRRLYIRSSKWLLSIPGMITSYFNNFVIYTGEFQNDHDPCRPQREPLKKPV
jgi:hypothetical protein